MDRQPIYMRVPPGHAKRWKKHCRDYNACGERVYFVQHNWYNREYVPRYRENQGGNRNNGQDGRRNNQGGGYGNNGQDGRRDDHGGGYGNNGQGRGPNR